MTSQNQTILNNLSAAVTEALTRLQEAQNAYNNIMDAVPGGVRDLQRQAEVHRTNGDNTNLQIVNQQLTAKYAQRDAALATLNDKRAAYEAALKAYQDAQNSILSQQEKDAIAAEAKAKAETSVIAAQSEAEKKLFAQKTTKYLIFGAIALIVIAVGVYVYKKKYAA